MRKLTILMTFLLFVGFQAAAQMEITGKVTNSETGEPIPGVSVVVKSNTTIGTATDMDGNYALSGVPSDAQTLVYTFVGMQPEEVAINGRTTIDVAMQPAVEEMDEVVVTALGITREKKTLSYGSQDVSGDQLAETGRVNLKDALAGKVSGIQIAGQAGSKLGSTGKIRLRGAISLTSDSDPLYVIDGVPTTNPNAVDVSEYESINVLKGPNATALYGQRAEFGVIVIETKSGAESGDLSVEINHNTTFDKVSYTPNYQNKYAQGYDGEAAMGVFDYASGDPYWGTSYPTEWQQFDGKLYWLGANNYADESWGPRIDGQEYVPWYAWWPESPYYGETAQMQAYPDNIKDFYETGVNMKTNVAISGNGDNYSARLSYTNQDQGGILPYTSLKKHMLGLNVNYEPMENLKFGANVKYSTDEINGNFADDYSDENMTTGSFNQWFARQLDMSKLKEMKDLENMAGYHANWNWWGPDYYNALGGGFQKPAFWFNPYKWQNDYDNTTNSDDLIGKIYGSYEFLDNFEVEAGASINRHNYARETRLPNSLALSAAPDLYNPWINGFQRYNSENQETNVYGNVKYNNKFESFDVSAMFGGNLRNNQYRRISTQMNLQNKSQGLLVPDVYDFGNAKVTPATGTFDRYKQVRSLYGNVSVGYKEMVYLDISGRNDWSSALPSDNNGYFYPSFGASFIFSEVVDLDVMSFGKIRASWGQVGMDVGAHRINPTYPLSNKPYTFSSGSINSLMYTNNQFVDPDIVPALNTSIEAGFDVRFLLDRLGLSATFYKETRENEIIPISVSRSTGYNTYLTNAGSSERKGIELTLNAVPVKIKNFKWDIAINWATNETVITSLPEGLDQMAAPASDYNAFGFVEMVHQLDGEWGQIYGAGYKLDDNGNKIINSDGTYAVEQSQYLGSVLPDWTGGIYNQFTIFEDISVSVNIDFQKGGKFFSLSEQWGTSSGLLEETADKNDKGVEKRDGTPGGAAEGDHGVHVTGVDASGGDVDMYVDAWTYYSQYYDGKLAEPFVHDADYVKLRDVSITYRLPQKWFATTFIKSASVGFIGRNLALLQVAEDNIHYWDPSELSETFGENGQLPGTRSYGFNVKLNF